MYTLFVYLDILKHTNLDPIHQHYFQTFFTRTKMYVEQKYKIIVGYFFFFLDLYDPIRVIF